MRSSPKPASAKQLRYLRSLAMQRGESFEYPRSAAQAHAEIERLLGRRRSTRAERREDRVAVSRAMARGGDGAAVRESEVAGYGSSARWADNGMSDEPAEERVVHCRREHYDVYIGRGEDPRSGEPGRWGNPYRTGRDGTREEVIALYAQWLRRQVEEERISLEELAALDGQVLGCWCAPEECHGEVLVRAAAWAVEMLRKRSVFWELRPAKRGGRMVPG